MVRAGYLDLTDRVLRKDEDFRTDPQLRAVFRRTMRAWDAAAVYQDERTYLGEVVGEHPTSLDVRLWRDEHSFEFPRIKDGEIRLFSKEQMEPIGAADIGTIVQYGQVEVRNFGITRLRRVGQLEIPKDANYAWGLIGDDREDTIGIRVFPGGTVDQVQEPIHFVIYSRNRLEHVTPHIYALVQINYDRSVSLTSIIEILRTQHGKIDNIAKIGFVSKAWSRLTDATMDILEYKPGQENP